ncbi:hypothetical protein ACHWQZ_G010600 [Mnemiopsis leidyi]
MADNKRSNRIQTQSDPLRSVKKSWKRAANKVTCNVKRLTHDSYATLPSNFTESTLRSLWNELEHKYFDFGEDELGISKQKRTLREFLDFHNKFIKSFQYEPTHDYDEVKSTILRKVHKKQANRFADLALEQLSMRTPYHLRATTETNYNENYLAHRENIGEFAQKFADAKNYSLKDHLYLEVLMLLEPLIDAANYSPANMAGKEKKLRSVQGAAYDFQGHTGFDTVNKRTMYFTELATSIVKLFPGLDKIKGPGSSADQSISHGPNLDVFVQFYLAHLANSDNHGKTIFKQTQGAGSVYGTQGDPATPQPSKAGHGFHVTCLSDLESSTSRRWVDRSSVKTGWYNYSYEFQTLVPRTKKVEKYAMHYHDLEQDPEKIANFRQEIQGYPKKQLEELYNDMRQFISDYNKIREIWYNVEPVEPGVERSKVHKASQLAMYIQNHPYYLRLGAASRKHTSWISKVICTLDVNICEEFINQVEKGMTVYDWHVFATKKFDWYSKWGMAAVEQKLVVQQQLTQNLSKQVNEEKKKQQKEIRDMKEKAKQDAANKLRNLLTDWERNVIGQFLQKTEFKLACKHGQAMPFVGPLWHPALLGVHRNALDAFTQANPNEVAAYAESD